MSPRRACRAGAALALALGALALSPAAALAQGPADQPPFGGELLPAPVTEPANASVDRAPAGFELSPAEVIAIADRTEAGTEARAIRSTLGERVTRARAVALDDRTWEVTYTAFGEPEALVVIEDSTGEVVEAWTGYQVETRLARGYPGAVGGIVNAVWIWLPLCFLFLAPFVDWRRPLRLLHLDLLALLAFSVSLYFFNRGEIEISVPLVYPVIGYLLMRLGLAGLRREERDEPLLPVVGPRLLLAGTGALVALYTAIAIWEAKVIDVGLASVIGADRLAGGEFVYGVGSATGQPLLVDVYGPVNYLAYLPFEQLFPWSGEWDSVPAARMAALAFTLLTALCLYGIGRRFREGAEGRTLGIALAFAWLAYPFTLYGLGSSFNDALVALLVTATLLALSSAPARGALAALAGLTKFGPLALAPLLAAGTGDRRPRSIAAYAVAFVVVAAVTTAVVIDGSSLREMYDRSLGYQAERGSPFSVWGQAPSLEPLQTALQGAAVLLGVVLFFVPRKRTPAQLAALAAVVLIAVQLPATHWFYTYVIWFAPLALIALLAPQRGPLPRADAAPGAPQG